MLVLRHVVKKQSAPRFILFVARWKILIDVKQLARGRTHGFVDNVCTILKHEINELSVCLAVVKEHVDPSLCV